MGSTNFSFSEAYAFRKLVSENKVKTSIFKVQAFKFWSGDNDGVFINSLKKNCLTFQISNVIMI